MKKVFFFNFLLWAVTTSVFAQLKPKEYDVKKLADGVYGFVWKDPMQNPIEGNSLFVINDEDVLVVDACIFPSSTRIMINELKKLTSKPVKWVVNTHWHDDHVNGDFVYKETWPGVEFIAQRNTRQEIIDKVINQRDTNIQNYKTQITQYSQLVKDGKYSNGKPIDSLTMNKFKEVIELFNRSIDEYQSVNYVTPTITFEDSIILYRGDRIIKIMCLGKGNTDGDAIIFLPKERIAATGDLFVYPIPFAFGSYYKEWVHTLEKVDSLPADILFPGHGFPQYDRNYIRQVRDVLKELVDEVDKAVADGLTLEETKKKITLPEWKKKFAGDDKMKQGAFDQFLIAPAVERAWHQAKGDKEGE